jgi:hypothetical protein
MARRKGKGLQVPDVDQGARAAAQVGFTPPERGGASPELVRLPTKLGLDAKWPTVKNGVSDSPDSILVAPLSQRPRCVATVTREVIIPAVLDLILIVDEQMGE